MTQTAGQASDHSTVVAVLSPEASQGKARYSYLFALVCQLELEGRLLADVLCGPRSTPVLIR